VSGLSTSVAVVVVAPPTVGVELVLKDEKVRSVLSRGPSDRHWNVHLSAAWLSKS